MVRVVKINSKHLDPCMVYDQLILKFFSMINIRIAGHVQLTGLYMVLDYIDTKLFPIMEVTPKSTSSLKFLIVPEYQDSKACSSKALFDVENNF